MECISLTSYFCSFVVRICFLLFYGVSCLVFPSCSCSFSPFLFCAVSWIHAPSPLQRGGDLLNIVSLFFAFIFSASGFFLLLFILILFALLPFPSFHHSFVLSLPVFYFAFSAFQLRRQDVPHSRRRGPHPLTLEELQEQVNRIHDQMLMLTTGTEEEKTEGRNVASSDALDADSRAMQSKLKGNVALSSFSGLLCYCLVMVIDVGAAILAVWVFCRCLFSPKCFNWSNCYLHSCDERTRCGFDLRTRTIVKGQY